MRRIALATVFVLAVSTIPALAHHPFAAEYDWKRPVTITGTVAKLDWKNPHTMLEIKGKDERGAEAQWIVELGGPGQLTRAGWTRNAIKTGDQVTVDGWLAKDGSKRLSAKSVTIPGGRELFAASSFYTQSQQSARAGGNTRSVAGTSGKEQPQSPR
jgi:hypothetical protein